MVVGLAFVGDPVGVPWLLGRMEPGGTAAGESLSMITGVDIDYEDLAGGVPEGSATATTPAQADTNVGPDPDERLPWPDPAKMEAWWAGESIASRLDTDT